MSPRTRRLPSGLTEASRTLYDDASLVVAAALACTGTVLYFTIMLAVWVAAVAALFRTTARLAGAARFPRAEVESH